MKYFYLIIPLSVLLFISFNNSAQAQNAKRGAPKQVTPVTIGQVKYTAPADSMGYIVAFDVTNKWIWSKKIFTITYIRHLETDVQDVFIDTIYLKNEKLYIRNEARHVYTMDLKTQEVIKVL